MPEIVLTNIRIVLVEPAGPLNVGSVARIMKNMGLHQLVLVNPQCDYLGEEARLMAVRAADILETAKVVETLPAALTGCTRAIATTGDDRTQPIQLETPASALSWLLETPSALIFGRENCGLTNTELNYAQRLIRIPSSDAYPSLNLAQAVAICCYEIYQEVIRRKKEEGRHDTDYDTDTRMRIDCGSGVLGQKEEATEQKEKETGKKEEQNFSPIPTPPLSPSPNLPLSPSPNLPLSQSPTPPLTAAALENLEGYY
ncbi:MAG: RNA methyltransferase, partial [Microcoleus sp.]